MKVITDLEEESTYIDVGITDLDGDKVLIYNADGYGGCDITIGTHTLRWNEFDKQYQALAAADKLWRKAP